MPMRLPRIRRSASPSSASTSVSPRRMALPGSTRPGGGTSRSSARLVRLLPHPDSPTSASVSPRSSVKLTPSTGWNRRPPGAGKETRRSRTSRTRVMRLGDRGRRAGRRRRDWSPARCTVIAIPGKIPIHGADSSTGRASRIIPPQDGVGGCTPSPRNERPASSRITSPTPSVAATSSGPAVFTSRCRKIIRRRDAPSASAARTKRLLPEAQHLGADQPAGREPAGRPDERGSAPASGTRSGTASTSSSRNRRGTASAPSTSRMSTASTAPPQ